VYVLPLPLGPTSATRARDFFLVALTKLMILAP
jgi:hypothetical protein